MGRLYSQTLQIVHLTCGQTTSILFRVSSWARLRRYGPTTRSRSFGRWSERSSWGHRVLGLALTV
jgi:hypothetical protein